MLYCSVNNKTVYTAIVKVGRNHRDLWASANYSNVSEHKRTQYINKLVDEIKNYLAERYRCYPGKMLRKQILYVWSKHIVRLCKDIDGTIVEM